MRTSAFAKTVKQLVGLVAGARRNRYPDTAITTAVLAVAEDAPRFLDDLNDACRQFDQGGAWAVVCGSLSVERRDALERFKVHAETFWNEALGAAPAEADLALLARLFRICRFGEDQGSRDWRESEALLGTRLFGTAEEGRTPLAELFRLLNRQWLVDTLPKTMDLPAALETFRPEFVNSMFRGSSLPRRPAAASESRIRHARSIPR